MASPEQDNLLILFVGGVCFVLLLVLGFFVLVFRSHKRLVKEQEKSFRLKEESQRQMLEAILQAQEAERKRIARELHDELGQVATVQKINLTLFRRKVAQSAIAVSFPDMLEEVDSMIMDADESIQSVKRLIKDLRPVSIDEVGLVGEIESLMGRVAQRTGIKIKFVSEIGDLGLAEEKAIEIFRIVQEAVTNVLRHAEATFIEVKVFRKDGKLIINIQDNGKGIDTEKVKNTKSFGMRGMAERAKLIGGSLQIGKAEPSGGRVTLLLPINGSS